MPRHGRFLWWAGPPAVRLVGNALFSFEVVHHASLPPPPFVVAANHYSHLDPPAIGAALDMPVHFIALSDLFGANPILDWLVVGFGAIPTPRGRVPLGALRSALAHLDAGNVVGVFPEATRVSHWGVLEPKRGAGWLASRARVPLVPVAVLGTGRALDLDNRLRRAPIRIVVGEALPSEGEDATSLTSLWADWISAQVARYPWTEPSGPRRAFHDGT